MAANKAQGRYLSAFLVTLTVACAGIAYFANGLGKLLAVLGALGVLASLFGFLKIKPEEGRTGNSVSSLGGKLLGALLSCLGWLLVLIGLHFTAGTGGRIVVALVGIGVSLFGILYVLPTVFNRNANWKT